MLNGIDVSQYAVGDVLVVPEAVAKMLIAEKWAEPVEHDSNDDTNHRR
jgi:hypothetical protein